MFLRFLGRISISLVTLRLQRILLRRIILILFLFHFKVNIKINYIIKIEQVKIQERPIESRLERTKKKLQPKIEIIEQSLMKKRSTKIMNHYIRV